MNDFSVVSIIMTALIVVAIIMALIGVYAYLSNVGNARSNEELSVHIIDAILFFVIAIFLLLLSISLKLLL